MSEAPRIRQNFGWLAAEFVVIVLGVMTAFAADQWNQNRQDEQTEIGYLERLKANLESDTTIFARAIEVNGISQGVLTAFLDVVDGTEPFPTDHVDFVAGLNGGLSARFDGPRRDTYNELINQGDLGRLRSLAVRQGLADYYGTTAAYAAGQLVEWEETARRVELLIIERLPADTYRWVQATAHIDGIADRSRVNFEPTPGEAQGLLSLVRADAEIRNLLFRHAQIQSRVAENHRVWMAAAAELLGTLDSELTRLRGG